MDQSALTPDAETPTAGPVSTPPRRRWPRIVLGLAAAALILFAGGSFLLSRYLDPERLAAWLEPRLETAVNRDVSVGAVEVGFLPLAVELRDLQVSDPTGLTDELAALESLQLRVKLIPLLRRQVQVREIVLDGLVANLVVGPDGLTNFGDFSPAEPEDPSPAEESRPFGLQLDGIRLTGGIVRYESPGDSLYLEVAELEADAAVAHETGGPWSFQGDYGGRLTFSAAAPGSGTLPTLSDVPLRLTMDAETAEDFGSVSIREGSLLVDQVSLSVSGEALRLKDPVRELRMAVQARGVPLSDLLALLPDSVRSARELRAGGSLSLNLQVQGPVGPDTVPTVEGDVAVQDGSLSMGRMTLLEGVTATAAVADDGSVRPRAFGTLLGGAFDVDGAVSLGNSPSADLRVAAAPLLDRVDEELLPEGVTMAGRLTTDLRVVGSPRDLTSLRFWGTLSAEDLRATHPGLGVPVQVAAARVEVEGNRATLPPATVVLGSDPVELEGTLLGLEGLMDGVIPEFRGTATGRRVSLVALVPDPPADTSLTYGRVAFARVGGRPVRGRSAEDAAQEMGLERPAGLPLAGEIRVALDTVIDRRGRMEEVEATLIFGPDFLQVAESSFRRYGGRIQTSAALELGSEVEEPFSLTLVAEGVDAGAFLGQTTPLGRAVRGTLDLDVDLVGALDALLLPSRRSLQGSGSFSLTGGGIDAGLLGARLADFLGIPALASPSVQDWSTGFILRDGMVVLEEARMAGAPGRPSVGGGVGLDGDLDLVTAFDVPREELGAAALERLGIRPGAGALETVAAVLRVGGSLSDPSLRADPQAMVQDVAGAVEERAREEMQQEVQQRREELRERATGFLRGLLGGRDTAQAPPPDTLRADTVRPDTVRPDTLRPDSVRPDTVPPDTVRPDTLRPDTARSGGAAFRR